MKTWKFRAYDKKEKKMITDFLNYAGWEGQKMINPWHDKRYIIQQYTGLKDKMGREICQDDVLECKRLDSTEIEIVAVKRNPGQFAVYDPNCCDRCKSDDGCTAYLSDWVYFPKTWEISIIGNMYENPELIVQCGYERESL